MDIRRTRTCDRCKSPTPLDKVRLIAKDKEQNLVLCEKCSTEFKQKASPASLRSQIKPLPKPDMGSYLCTRCKYKFRSDGAKEGVLFRLHCPYCGKSDRLEKV